MTTISTSIRCSLLISGYMRIEYCKHDNYDQFETSLVKIIVRLLGNIFMIFDVYPLKCKSMFSDDGLVFKKQPSQRGIGDVTFGCSYGWNKGIHKISIKNKYEWNEQGIGITNRIQKFTEKAAWYGYFNSDMGEYSYNLNGKNLVGTDIESQNFVFESKNAGGVVTIHFDGDNGTLTFLYDDKIIGKSVNIKRNETYYPFISYNADNGPAEFHLINALE